MSETFTRDLNSWDTDKFLTELKAFFAAIPYELYFAKGENCYQTIFYMVFMLLGQFIEVEKRSAAGLRRRLDLARATLEAANPNAILERGLSLVTKAASGEIVRRAADVKPGDLLRIQPAEGVIHAEVRP
jgi:hypothetical protein